MSRSTLLAPVRVATDGIDAARSTTPADVDDRDAAAGGAGREPAG